MNGVPATVVEDLIAVDRLFNCAILLDGGFATKRLQTQLIAVCIVPTHHDLRHLFAARCVEGGVDVSTAADMLGGQRTDLACMANFMVEIEAHFTQ